MWKNTLLLQGKRIQKLEKQAQVVAYGVYMHDSFLATPALLKEEIETFNPIKVQGTPRWLAKKEKLA